jgi:hypothetical protein
VTLDFARIAEGVVKNNMGLGGIEIVADASVAEGKVTIHPTGQTFPLHGDPPAQTATVRRRLKIVEPFDAAKTSIDPED